MLENKVAFISGGSSGIGAATARRLSKDGAGVALVARTIEKLEKVIDDLETEALPLQVDVSDPDAVADAFEKTSEHFGRLDIVVANAGINGRWAPIEELETEDWRQTMDINLSGTFYTIKYAVPYLKRQGGGSIIVTSSINGTRQFSLSGATAYATSKAGQVAMAQMLALELAPSKIRVNVVCPGQIETDIEESTERNDLEEITYPAEFPKGTVPLTGGEAAPPEDVAELIAFLASDQSRFITGTPIWIDGAQSLFKG